MSGLRNVFFLLILISVNVNLSAQGFLRAEGKEIVNENGEPFILKGMGLGGWMLQEGYMLQTASFANAQWQLKEKITDLIGEDATNEFYDAWLANHVTKTDIDSLKSWGFNSVRLPMHYNLFTLPIQEEPVEGENTWLDKGFILTDSLISWCKQNEMYVILDLHAAPGGQGYDQGISDYNPALPSIFESIPNRRKTASLWKRIAERYADEPWVAGYDLINEPNWNIPGGNALRNIYFQITDSIRAVDQKHIMFVEGNWFANDFTGLTPPWDDNMVYSPHKYWSVNDPASMQWVVDMREQYDVPLYLGETGENSNTWFHDAIDLFDELNMGWAWWPMKKVESIAGPYSAIKSPEYQTLLDYWEDGGTAPSAEFAKAALMGLAESFKIENCVFQKDVIDAMFRQQTTDATLPYSTQNIPGVVYPSDFDLGKNGNAYFDADVATYQVTTGNFTSWNNGWIYRNDGVDLEKTLDVINSNGISVGWINTGEWMQYDVAVASDAVYDVEMRVASNQSGGAFHFEMDGAVISESITVESTGGWDVWETIFVENVVLNTSNNKLRFVCDKDGFNLGGMNFIEKGMTNTIPATFLFAKTIDEQSIQVDLNKRIVGPLPSIPADFEIRVNNASINIEEIEINPSNGHQLNFSLNQILQSTDVIRITYNGTGVTAEDGTSLENFTLKPVQNNIRIVHAVPGRIEAEDYFFQSGVQLENTSDVGGGQNIGFLDPGDYLDYWVDIQEIGTYNINFRTAAQSEEGGVELQLIDVNGGATTLLNATFPSTGGWQTWTTTNKTISFSQTGEQQIRMLITDPLFNVNWMEFDFLSSTSTESSITNVSIFPNPSHGIFTINADLENVNNPSFIGNNKYTWRKSTG